MPYEPPHKLNTLVEQLADDVWELTVLETPNSTLVQRDALYEQYLKHAAECLTARLLEYEELEQETDGDLGMLGR